MILQFVFSGRQWRTMLALWYYEVKIFSYQHTYLKGEVYGYNA